MKLSLFMEKLEDILFDEGDIEVATLCEIRGEYVELEPKVSTNDNGDGTISKFVIVDHNHKDM